MFIAASKVPEQAEWAWCAYVRANGKDLGLDLSKHQAAQNQIRDWYGDPTAPGSTYHQARNVKAKGHLEFRPGLDMPVIVVESLTDLPGQKPIGKVWSAKELTRAVMADGNAILKRYDKLTPVAVEGLIKKVVDQDNAVIIYLEGDTDLIGKFGQMNVACTFAKGANDAAKDAAKIKVGQTITIVGTGLGAEGSNLVIGSCELGPANPVTGSEDSDL